MATKFENVSSSYGAPMGRCQSGFLETDVPRFVRLFRVRLDSGGYDDGGAYWGSGAALWCAIDDDGNRQFVRAIHRERAALMLGIPAPALKRGLQNWATYAVALLDGRAPMPSDVTRADVIEWMKRSGARMGQSS